MERTRRAGNPSGRGRRLLDMGKPTGFLEFPRELPLVRAPRERIRDWLEFHEHAEDQRRQTQGARGWVGGGRSGKTVWLSGGRAWGCRTISLIPGWTDLAYRGLGREAIARL